MASLPRATATVHAIQLNNANSTKSSIAMLGAGLGLLAAEMMVMAVGLDMLFTIDATEETEKGLCGWRQCNIHMDLPQRWKEIDLSDDFDLSAMMTGFFLWRLLGIISVVLGTSASLAAVVPRKERKRDRMYAMVGLILAGVFAFTGASLTFLGGKNNWCVENGKSAISVHMGWAMGLLFWIAAALVIWNKTWTKEIPASIFKDCPDYVSPEPEQQDGQQSFPASLEMRQETRLSEERMVSLVTGEGGISGNQASSGPELQESVKQAITPPDELEKESDVFPEYEQNVQSQGDVMHENAVQDQEPDAIQEPEKDENLDEKDISLDIDNKEPETV